MADHQLDIIYGVIASWNDLVRLDYVIKIDDNGLFGLTVIPAWYHNWVAKLEEKAPERLPASYRAIMNRRNNPEITELYEEDHELVCVGIRCGTVKYTRDKKNIGAYPTTSMILAAITAFKAKAPYELIKASGQVELHYIPDNHSCCTY